MCYYHATKRPNINTDKTAASFSLETIDGLAGLCNNYWLFRHRAEFGSIFQQVYEIAKGFFPCREKDAMVDSGLFLAGNGHRPGNIYRHYRNSRGQRIGVAQL